MAPVAVLASLLTLSAAAQPAATRADDLVAHACGRAAASHRNVMVVFHASWCRWCHKLESLLATPDVKRPISGSYEIVWVDVQERRDKVGLETPGGNELLARLGGGRGLPFVAFLSPAGETMATTGEIGYPATPEEIEAFLGVLRKTGPRLTTADLDLVRARLGGR